MALKRSQQIAAIVYERSPKSDLRAEDSHSFASEGGGLYVSLYLPGAGNEAEATALIAEPTPGVSLRVVSQDNQRKVVEETIEHGLNGQFVDYRIGRTRGGRPGQEFHLGRDSPLDEDVTTRRAQAMHDDLMHRVLTALQGN